MKNGREIISIEYWLDSAISSYQVTKEDFYNSYLSCFSKFKLIKFNDGTEIIINL